MDVRLPWQLFLVTVALSYVPTALAQDLVHVTVDLHDPSHLDVDPSEFVEVRLSRLRFDGSVTEVFHGRDLKLPIGHYRVEALLDENWSIATLLIDLQQSEVRVALGVSLLNYMNLPGDYLGRLSIALIADGEPSEYSVRILPIWHNDFSIGVALESDWSAELGPVDLGDYAIVVLRGAQVLLTKHVEIPRENPHVRLDLNLREVQSR